MFTENLTFFASPPIQPLLCLAQDLKGQVYGVVALFPSKELSLVIPPGLWWYVKMSRNRSLSRLHNRKLWSVTGCWNEAVLGVNSWQCLWISAHATAVRVLDTSQSAAACNMSLHNSRSAWHGEICADVFTYEHRVMQRVYNACSTIYCSHAHVHTPVPSCSRWGYTACI